MIVLAEKEGAGPVVEQMLPKLLGETTQKERADVMETVRNLALQQTPTAIANALRALRDRPDSLNLLPQIKVPTLVVVGAEDTITPVSMAQTLADNIPNAKLEIIPQAGHLSNIEQSEIFNRVVLDFARGL
jgi:pimeloyl-ACP methyl ester carboxylesterase